MSDDERYKAHYSEIERRDAVAKSPQAIDDMERIDSDFDYPYEMPNQHAVVISFATPQLTPITHPRNTAIKICGVFPSTESATEFACSELMDFGDSLAVRSTREWHIVPESADRTDTDLRHKKERILQEHKVALESGAREFDERVKCTTVRNTSGESTQQEEDVAHPRLEPSPDNLSDGARNEGLAKNKRHPRGLEIRDQIYAVASFIDDRTNLGACNEFVFKIHGVFPTEHDASVYMVNTAAGVEKDVDMYIVPCYEWLAPSKLEAHADNGKVYYRNRELQGLMRGAMGNRAKVDSYEAQCTREGMEPAVTRIESDRVAQPADAVTIVEMASQDAETHANGVGGEVLTEPDELAQGMQTTARVDAIINTTASGEPSPGIQNSEFR